MLERFLGVPQAFSSLGIRIRSRRPEHSQLSGSSPLPANIELPCPRSPTLHLLPGSAGALGGSPHALRHQPSPSALCCQNALLTTTLHPLHHLPVICQSAAAVRCCWTQGLRQPGCLSPIPTSAVQHKGRWAFLLEADWSCAHISRAW